jgi:alkyl hydroperoxide reductase subunit AhpC
MRTANPAAKTTCACATGLLAVAALLAAAVAVAPSCARAQTVKAPDFRFDECAYADSIVLSDFSRFPVLLFFFDAGDVACIKSYGYLINWATKYSADGLKVIGIQSSPYAAMASWPNIANALSLLEYEFPIGLDYDREVSNLYDVHTVPTWVLIEPGGAIAMRTSKMSEYRDLEMRIQDVLREIEPGVILPFLFKGPQKSGEASNYPPPTPRVVLAYGSGSIANQDSAGPGVMRRYADPGGRERGIAYLDGPWKLEEGRITHEEGESAYIRVIYSGKAVWLLPDMKPGEVTRIYVEQDRSPLRDDSWGKDVGVDLEGRTYVRIRYSSPKQIVDNPEYGTHELKIIPGEGVESLHYLYFEGER